MADVLIRGMYKPQNCMFCPCMDREYGSCNIRELLHLSGDDCPLVELPKHGDLIDRSKLLFACGGTTPMEMDYVRRYVVDGMPVVIPSNKRMPNED